jgi:hypothetical protein
VQFVAIVILQTLAETTRKLAIVITERIVSVITAVLVFAARTPAALTGCNKLFIQ